MRNAECGMSRRAPCGTTSHSDSAFRIPHSAFSLQWMIALARKYRPKQFADLIVQDHVAAALRGAVAHGRTAHGYLFAGPRGVGKTTAARILAMALNCERRAAGTGEPCGACDSCTRIWTGAANLDVVELDAASNRGVDDARELRERAMYAASAEGRHKVYIVDEAHMLTRQAGARGARPHLRRAVRRAAADRRGAGRHGGVPARRSPRRSGRGPGGIRERGGRNATGGARGRSGGRSAGADGGSPSAGAGARGPPAPRRRGPPADGARREGRSAARERG